MHEFSPSKNRFAHAFLDSDTLQQFSPSKNGFAYFWIHITFRMKSALRKMDSQTCLWIHIPCCKNLALRKMDVEERLEQETLLKTYKNALGIY